MHSLESLLQKCTSLSRIKQLQAHLLVSGQFQSTNACTRLVELCAISPSGDLSFTTRVFHRILRPSTNDFNAILRGIAPSPPAPSLGTAPCCAAPAGSTRSLAPSP
ncbi:hypothetical protein ACJRO7_006102 [Eucalyptus globulus]|uniref:Uncharacterized protein n=1 Tax=Eucalyptus globulus TaxID=34317 RepID=A0ABD3IKH7_EUCGL